MNDSVAVILKRAAMSGAAATLLACSTSRAPQARVDANALATAVKSKLAKDARLANTASVGVNARTGIVTLSGRVRTPEERESAGRLACSAKGVTVVYNQLDVVRGER
ncbi:MAG TPA: BON domain-containing protein [Thermoanaerobaculia bacterium]|nr:BON domain-containing protein [Thermoanaerobaculia bacterium]